MKGKGKVVSKLHIVSAAVAAIARSVSVSAFADDFSKWELMDFDLTSNGSKIGTLHVDPWLFSLGVGDKF